MALPLAEWVDLVVRPLKMRSLAWLSGEYFFRDPNRVVYTDPNLLFAPADGTILYQQVVEPDEPLLDIKGVPYTCQDVLADPSFDEPALVIGIFLSFYDVHIVRTPYSGRVTHRQVEPTHSYNRPMLDAETELLSEMRVPERLDYLATNERVVTQIDAVWPLERRFHVVQIADYDVDCIVPFETDAAIPVGQSARLSQIRFGSQVDIVIPGERLETLQEVGWHVEAGVDPLVRLS